MFAWNNQAKFEIFVNKKGKKRRNTALCSAPDV